MPNKLQALLPHTQLSAASEKRIQIALIILWAMLHTLLFFKYGVRYNFKDVVEYEKTVSRFIPNSKLVLIVSGEAVGCVDFAKITQADIQFQGDTLVQVALPAPEICYYKVDHSKSKVFSKENTYFQDAELVEEGYKYAEQNVKKAALNSGILRQTTENAEKILKPMLEEITGRRVVLVPQRRIQNPQVPPKR